MIPAAQLFSRLLETQRHSGYVSTIWELLFGEPQGRPRRTPHRRLGIIKNRVFETQLFIKIGETQWERMISELRRGTVGSARMFAAGNVDCSSNKPPQWRLSLFGVNNVYVKACSLIVHLHLNRLPRTLRSAASQTAGAWISFSDPPRPRTPHRSCRSHRTASHNPQRN